MNDTTFLAAEAANQHGRRLACGSTPTLRRTSPPWWTSGAAVLGLFAAFGSGAGGDFADL
jgi:hypothetical protein